MAVSDSQFLTWSSIGASSAAEQTYTSIKAAIDSITWIDSVKYEIYLQGSYRNSTNIRGDSDVDVIVQLTSIFHYDVNLLTEDQIVDFNNHFRKSKFTLYDFKNAIFQGLKVYYGDENVTLGSKSIAIKGFNGRLHADVLCCIEYRKYQSFTVIDGKYISGIQFLSAPDNRWVINYPKLHYQNGVDKNTSSRANQNYKPVTRIFKNIKTVLVGRGDISKKLAPSYFIQCLLFNVADHLFIGKSFQDIFQKVLIQLIFEISNNRATDYICQNGQLLLFGDSKEQWNTRDAGGFLNAVLEFTILED